MTQKAADELSDILIEVLNEATASGLSLTVGEMIECTLRLIFDVGYCTPNFSGPKIFTRDLIRAIETIGAAYEAAERKQHILN